MNTRVLSPSSMVTFGFALAVSLAVAAAQVWRTAPPTTFDRPAMDRSAPAAPEAETRAPAIVEEPFQVETAELAPAPSALERSFPSEASEPLQVPTLLPKPVEVRQTVPVPGWPTSRFLDADPNSPEATRAGAPGAGPWKFYPAFEKP